MSQEKLIAWLYFPGNLQTQVNPLVTFNTPQNSTNCANNMSNSTRLAETARNQICAPNKIIGMPVTKTPLELQHKVKCDMPPTIFTGIRATVSPAP